MVIAVAKVDGMTFKFGLGGGIDFYVGGIVDIMVCDVREKERCDRKGK